MFPSPGHDKLYPKESKEEGLTAIRNQKGKEGGEEAMCMATVKEQETFYSPLGEADVRDLPSFAYHMHADITRNGVCSKYNEI